MSIRIILCFLLSHRYVVEWRIAPHWRKVSCTRCQRQWGMHDPTRSLLPWDAEQQAMAHDHYGLGEKP